MSPVPVAVHSVTICSPSGLASDTQSASFSRRTNRSDCAAVRLTMVPFNELVLKLFSIAL